MITEEDIQKSVYGMGFSGLPVCLHSSLRSFGYIRGGAQAVINGFLAEGCTLLVPSFSDDFAVPPPAGQQVRRNGWAYAHYAGPLKGIDRVYTPQSNEITQEEMGVIPATVLSQPGRLRGNHPLNSFTAIGKQSGGLIGHQTPSDVFAPLQTLCEIGGWVVLIGVGLDKITLIHAAEEVAGRKPFVRWANGAEGTPIGVRVGGCSNGFENLKPALSPRSKSCQVGTSHWEAYYQPLGSILPAIGKHTPQHPLCMPQQKLFETNPKSLIVKMPNVNDVEMPSTEAQFESEVIRF